MVDNGHHNDDDVSVQHIATVIKDKNAGED